ncbi:hypothetical protein SAMN04489713_12880 [Actinomadura madurae]|uniref:Sulfotransferase family protein n=1 Tax=Actinomadura madurae TaxID=1993 RepID=A0A1I5XW98_9ACTN|nr:sulfotransferase domain-containing protein [Actinomadura madurae]SFQ36140.1 hypothetical protein SAMN04489713_12880 [Actinomadura madurae]
MPPVTSETVRDETDRAERVIVVSIMKSGTHLIQELMVALGYGVYGQSRVTPDIRPVLDDDTRRRLIRAVHEPADAERLASAGGQTFREASDEAWSALAWSWQAKFGMPLENRYGREIVNGPLVEQALHRTAGSDFAETPANVAWILTEFDVPKIDGHFLREWSETGRPRIIFNYRDPRDVLLSAVNFLAGRTKNGYGNFAEFKVFNRILRALPTLGDRLLYAMTDPSFPGHDAYEKALWLLHHPDVCKVSFEELVGPQGGGSAEAQREAVGRVLRFLGVDDTPENIAPHLFKPDAFSFYKGQIGSWRDAFTPEHEKLFADRYGEMLSAYGYLDAV